MVSAKVILLWSLVFTASALAGTVQCQNALPTQTGSILNTDFSYSCDGNEVFSGFALTASSPNVPMVTIPTTTYQVQTIAAGQVSIDVTLNFAIAPSISDETFTFTYSVAPPSADVLVQEKDQISLVSTTPVFTGSGGGLSISEYACAPTIPVDSCGSTNFLGDALYPTAGTSNRFTSLDSLGFSTTVEVGKNINLSMFSETLAFVATTNSPEPSSILLMASGLAGCLLTCWKRRRKS
jgi:hypothetical protein